ncbi:MerR family transcriptional regulator [Streptomyces sp. CC77]|uniref:helix-turn-helix domain-containing protein n=1 Tax=Streptomyces sp. CC77 TaxID=1906739 RepID=UPI0008DD0170|nr:MerR family transcriptional regulator [Streptomyces sp. CC77]OII67361.1 hypothetical protein BJP39_25120 [Streptomyces sp. CC77]
MSGDDTWSIGELAERAGVSVRTVRFYTQQGYLPGTARSPGGHRRYGAAALERLRTLRSLRALDLPLPTAADVAGGRLALADAAAHRLRAVRDDLARLAWRRACLEALAEAEEDPAALAERLHVLGAADGIPDPDGIAAFWRRVQPTGVPAAIGDAVGQAATPVLPAAPTARQALAYARLHALASDRAFAAEVRQREHAAATASGTGPPQGDPLALHEGLGEAYTLAAGHVARGTPPGPGAALHAFTGAYAASRGTEDSRGFRQALLRRFTTGSHPRMAVSWRLAAEATALPPQRWFIDQMKALRGLRG